MKILYFAWLKTRVGTGEEKVSPPDDVADVAGLVRWLATQSPGHAEAFAELSVVRADFDHKKKENRREWVRARLAVDQSGALVARKFPREGAGILSSMVEADGLVELPEDLTRLEAGTMVDFLPFSEVS